MGSQADSNAGLLWAGLFSLSLSSLALEILLARIFAISQWNHLAFMVISLALLGFAVSGTWLAILDWKFPQKHSQYVSAGKIRSLLLAYGLSAAGSMIYLNWLPLDYYRIASQPIQLLYLGTAYFALALPFFFAGNLVIRAYMAYPKKSGRTYLVNMAGSALGAALPVVMLPHLEEFRLALSMAVLPLILVVFPLKRRMSPSIGDNRIAAWVGGMVLLGATAFLLFSHGDDSRIRPSPYKTLSQMLHHPEARVVAGTSGIDGRIEHLRSPQIRFAPGLSLKYRGRLPAQEALYTDGDEEIVLYLAHGVEDFSFSKQGLTWAAYRLTAATPKVLVLLKNGGSAIPAAIAAGARDITVVHPNESIIRALAKCYTWAGAYAVRANLRGHVRTTKERYDIIQVENWGARLPGTAGLTMAHEWTKTALADYLERLTPSGVLMISRRLLLPPANSLRVWSTAYEALADSGVERPEAHLFMLRNWGLFTLLVKKRAITAEERNALKNFARNFNFDVVDYAGMAPREANRFNRLKRPYHHLAIAQLKAAYATGAHQGALTDYLLDVRPQDDGRPYPERFLKWRRIRELYRSLGSRIDTLALSGEIVVAAVFMEALLLSFLLLLLPVLTFFRKPEAPRSHKGALFFFGLGAGFILIEIFFIKSFALVLADPVESFALVLFVFLLFSAIGGAISRHLKRCHLPYILGALIALALLGSLLILPITRLLLAWPRYFQTAALVGLLLPPGILAGMPFALGIQHLALDPRQRALGWAANGCASVLAAIAAAQIAVAWGHSAIIILAALFYGQAFLAVVMGRSR